MAAIAATLRRRYIVKSTPAKPMIIIAHVAGSGPQRSAFRFQSPLGIVEET
jgi:hypothetical protein